MAEARRVTGKPPVTVRRVDFNKGDDEHPEYRSRQVAAKVETDQRPDLFAGTPPVEAIRLILSDAATGEGGAGRHTKCLMVNDVKRAYFHAECTRDVYVQLPKEDVGAGEEGSVESSSCPCTAHATPRRTGEKRARRL